MVGFDVSADAYARFMGRFSESLAVEFADLLAPSPGSRALDVGCGPGALTAVLVDRLGVANVRAIDPSTTFVAAARERFPDIDVRQGSAEEMPWPDGSFDLAAASLVVQFMPDPVGGLREMARVTTAGGTVAATIWDHAGEGRGPLSPFWRVARELDPGAYDESAMPGIREGQLAELFTAAGIDLVADTELTVRARYDTADEWWQSYTLGVGPAGAYVAGLDAPQRERLRQRCLERLPPAPFEIPATAWTVIGRS